MCFVNNTLSANVGGEKWGVVWGWEGDGLFGWSVGLCINRSKMESKLELLYHVLMQDT